MFIFAGLSLSIILENAVELTFSNIALAADESPRETKSLLTPTDLRCEYLLEPLGIDILKPRLGWRLETSDSTAFDQEQAAYRIWVAESKEILTAMVQDETVDKDHSTFCWDSGWIHSNCSQQIEYNGKPLQSDRTYYWQVQIIDNNNQTSQMSTIASWSTGLFDSTDWSGKWIGSDQILDRQIGIQKGNNNIDDPWFRKTFDLSQKPKRAILFVASLGYHQIFVNGKQIHEDVLAPNVSDHTKRARYIAYDIADELVEGSNVIGIWLGVSWSIFPSYITEDKPQTPLLLAQTDIQFNDGSALRIATDESWKTSSSPNRLLGNWDSGNYGGEHWDANRENPNWNQIDFDDQNWKSATTYSPQLILSAQRTQPNRLKKEILPIAIEDKGNNVWRVDMGVNFAGWTEIKVEGNPGDVIEFQYSEAEKAPMTFHLFSRYTIGPSGKGTFKNRFNYSSGRWITISGLKKKPELSDIRGWTIRTDFEPIATFECSEDLQNWIYQTALWTFENLSIGGYVVDCPQRERLGYGGDSHATSEAGLNNYRLDAFYSKWLQDWRDVQGREANWLNLNDPDVRSKVSGGGRYLNNGILPNTAPTYAGGGGPAWGGICVILPWFLYEQFGDQRVLEENFDMIVDWIDFLESNTKDNLLEKYGDIWVFLGDWLWPGAPDGPNSNTPEALCFNNCYRIFNLMTAAKIAKTLGKFDQAENWEKLAEAARQAVHAKYFNAEDNSYWDGSTSILAVALLANIPPAHLRNKVMQRLEKEILVNNKGHIGSGITGGGLLFKLLRQERRDDLIYSMTSQTEYPSWGFMRQNGATTFWEAWEKDRPGHSLLHSSYLYPGAWFIDSVLGIRPDLSFELELDSAKNQLIKQNPSSNIKSVGFQQIVIQPPKFDALPLQFARGSLDSAFGKIVSKWEKSEKNGNSLFNMTVIIPPNTKATIFVPSQQKEKVSANEKARWIEDRNGYSIFKTGSGTFEFQSQF